MRTCGALAAVLLLLSGLPVRAAEPPAPSTKESQESAERAELFVGLLRRRAQRLLEAHRAPPPPLFSFSGGLSQGHESNVNLDGSKKGDHFTEETLGLLFRPRLNPCLSFEGAYDMLNTHYFEATDSNLWSNSWSGMFQIQPTPRIRFDAGGEYGIFNFPEDTKSSFFDHKVKAFLSFAQTAWLTHKAGWSYLYREYDTRLARDADFNQVAGLNREDRRHTGSYELRLRFPKTFMRLGTEYYRNFSNEHFQDYYDWSSFRVGGVLTRILSAKWLGSLTASQERKNYQSRSVPTIDMAERDDLLTLGGSLIYQFHPNASLSFSVTYRHQDSNDPRLDFTDWINQVGVTLSF